MSNISYHGWLPRPISHGWLALMSDTLRLAGSYCMSHILWPAGFKVSYLTLGCSYVRYNPADRLPCPIPHGRLFPMSHISRLAVPMSHVLRLVSPTSQLLHITLALSISLQPKLSSEWAALGRLLFLTLPSIQRPIILFRLQIPIQRLPSFF
jgi:hypothetical protein